MSVHVRDVLSRLARRPPTEWSRRLQRAFPDDRKLRAQALLWLHADRDGLADEGTPPSLGEVADERYELSVRLDIGATASVWQAFDRKLGRNVAIKVFHEAGESELLEQVLAEARAASDVISDHVVRVLDVNQDDGQPYIVMELVGEHDPAQGTVVFGTAASSARPESIEEVARWVMEVARGVHDAHLRNVFHRDLKPKNVLVTPISRRARVADFGLAVSSTNPDAAHPAMMLLKGGPAGPLSVRGTPEYMAPEQARGLAVDLDPRVVADRAVLVAIDVWGLGAIAYELLTGTPPWRARPSDDLAAWEIAASGERPAPLERARDGERIPRRLRRVLEKAMALEPTRRYSTAAALARELQAFLARRPTTLDRSRALRVWLWSRRNPQLAATALLLVGMVTAFVVSRWTRVQLRAERNAFQQEVMNQRTERARLVDDVARSRAELEDTRAKLLTERENLAALESSLAEERASYTTVLQAKEKALGDANAATRHMLDQLEHSRRDRRASEAARAALARELADARHEVERANKDRDRMRRERDAARAERDAAQRERDAAIDERDRAQQQRKRRTGPLGRASPGG